MINACRAPWILMLFNVYWSLGASFTVKCCTSTSYYIIDSQENGRDVGCGTHHMMNEPSLRTTSDECTGPGNEAKKRYQALQSSRLWFRGAFSFTWNRAAQILELQSAGGMHIVVRCYLKEPFDFSSKICEGCYPHTYLRLDVSF